MDCQLIRRVQMARNAEISQLRRASIALLVLGTTLNCLLDRDNDATDYPFSNWSFAVSCCCVTNLSDTKGCAFVCTHYYCQRKGSRNLLSDLSRRLL